MKVKKNMYIMLCCIFVVLILGMTAFYMLNSSSTKPLRTVKEKFASNEEAVATPAPQNNTPKVRVMLFYATWCPHCENYLSTGVYDTFQKKIEEDTTISVKVTFEKYDYDKNQELGDKYGISSFPTIIAVDDSDKVFRFNGSRDSELDMKKFIRAVAEKKSLGPREYE